jgi:hypothetical protein
MSGTIASTRFPANWEFHGITADEERAILEVESLELPVFERQAYVAEGLRRSTPATRNEHYALRWSDVLALISAAPFGGWQVLVKVGSKVVDVPAIEPIESLAEACSVGEEALLGRLSGHERMRVLALLRDREKVG